MVSSIINNFVNGTIIHINLINVPTIYTFFQQHPLFYQHLINKMYFYGITPPIFEHNINYFINYSQIKKEPLSSFFSLYELMKYCTSVTK